MRESTLRRLAGIVGPDRCLLDPAQRACYGVDASRRRAMPEAVVLARSAAEVVEVLRLANQEGFPVTPRGAGSGMSGGAVPLRGGVVLSLAPMRSILDLDRADGLAVVEPGVITGELQAAAEREGMFYPPDPASLEFCTLGGNVAECAGGPRAVKYGVTRDWLLGMEAVLPEGEVVHLGGRTLKGVVGYDLLRLMAGSEGTLGVFTRLILRLIPRPESRLTFLALFREAEELLHAALQLLERTVPSRLEFMDRLCVECAAAGLPPGVPRGHGLLVELDGPQGAVRREAERVRACLRGARALLEEAGEAAGLWRARRSLSASLFRLAPSKLNQDVTVPRSQVGALLRRLEGISARCGLPLPCFGHLGDGNLHVNVMYDEADPGQRQRAEEAVRELFRAVLDLGGTLSGEHGVGLTKLPYLRWEAEPAVLERWWRIKRALDPRGVLNPGKALG